MKNQMTHCQVHQVVHMQADNIFVDMHGDWWLGDFGSAISAGEPVIFYYTLVQL